MAHIVFHVQDTHAVPIPGAAIHAESSLGPWNGTTDNNGDFPAELGAAHYDLTINKPGYTTLQMPADLEYPGTVWIALHASGDVPAAFMNGLDNFMAYRHWLDGLKDPSKRQLLDAMTQESRDHGFDSERVFMTGAASQNAAPAWGFAGLELSPFEPHYREQLRPFAEYYQSRGLRLLATFGVDYQVQCPKEADQFMVWSWGSDWADLGVEQAARNEGDKNGVVSKPFPAIPGVSCSQGSFTQDLAPLRPELDNNEFHQRRNYPNRETDAVASPINLRDIGYRKPLRMTEGIPFGEIVDSTTSGDAGLARKLGLLYRAEWDGGAVLHVRNRQMGKTMNDTEKRCADAWSKGMGQ